MEPSTGKVMLMTAVRRAAARPVPVDERRFVNTPQSLQSARAAAARLQLTIDRRRGHTSDPRVVELARSA